MKFFARKTTGLSNQILFYENKGYEYTMNGENYYIYNEAKFNSTIHPTFIYKWFYTPEEWREKMINLIL